VEKRDLESTIALPVLLSFIVGQRDPVSKVALPVLLSFRVTRLPGIDKRSACPSVLYQVTWCSVIVMKRNNDFVVFSRFSWTVSKISLSKDEVLSQDLWSSDHVTGFLSFVFFLFRGMVCWAKPLVRPTTPPYLL